MGRGRQESGPVAHPLCCTLDRWLAAGAGSEVPLRDGTVSATTMRAPPLARKAGQVRLTVVAPHYVPTPPRAATWRDILLT